MDGSSTIQYRFLGAEVGLALEEPMLLDPLRRLFPEYQTQSPPTTDAPPALVVLRSEDGHVVEKPNGERSVSRNLNDLVVAVEFALTEIFLACCPGLMHVHASGAVVGEGALLVLGRAGAGKSSLALHWLQAGHRTLGDDVVLVDQDGRAMAFKRFFKVDPTVLAGVGLNPAETVFWYPGADTAWYDPGSDAGWADPAPITALVLSRFRPGATLSLSEPGRVHALNALAHSLMPTGLDRSRGMTALAAIAERVRVVEVTFGAAAEAAHAIAERVR